MISHNKSEKSNVIRESYLDFLLELYNNGVDLEPESINLLVKSNRINLRPIDVTVPSRPLKDEIPHLHFSNDLNKKADERIDVVTDVKEIPYIEEGKRHGIVDTETYDNLSKSKLFRYSGGKTITSEDWKPKDILIHTRDFIDWIDSINRGFQSMIEYKPFAMYCQQAYDWLQDERTINSFKDLHDKKEYGMNEMKRCRENTLYFMDKYLQLKEGDLNTGNMKYDSKPVHKVLCFLIDCGYSMMIGKPRQIAATSTLGGVALCKALTRRNFFLKMVAQDKDKTIEIFEDKIKYPFGELPNWMKPEVANDRDNLFRFAKKTAKKGSKGGANAKIQVVAPSTSAINGGSPQLVLIDEAGYIPILGRMIKEARPTMFMQDPETGKLKMTRQIIVWGTGGEMDKGGRSFETEFYNNLKLWKDGVYTSGMIPLFFDWTTRPGITKEHYMNERKVYTVEGPEKEKKAVQFRQAYPSVIEDMFLSSHKLLVGMDWINEQTERIQKTQHKFRPIKGYFEPIYDESRPDNENSDTPYRITGARFIPCDDKDEDMATVEILMEPKKGWRNRYYQGTDPVMTDNGYSNMASVVFDSVLNTPVAIMDYKNPDHKYTFLQCVLLSLYYDTNNEGGIKELVESNVGTAYFDYKESKGFYNSLVQRTELPDFMQGGAHLYGIDNRASRNKFIINKMFEVLTAYGERFYFKKIFDQLRTFVCVVNEKGNTTWGVTDTRNFNDDVLFGLVFSYICALSYSHRTPIDTSSDTYKSKVEYRLVRGSNGKLTRVAVKVRQ